MRRRPREHQQTTFCRICEATCGLRVRVRENRVVAIEPDREHVATRGYACIKGTRFAEVQASPDRVLHPMKRVGNAWRRISWDEAIGEIGEKIRGLVARHGPDALAHFMGSPAGATTLAPPIQQAFVAGLGSRQTYGVGSVDCNNKFRVNQEMYGSPFRLAFPDVPHTRFFMLLGSNPSVSNTSLFHLPHSIASLRAVVRRGGRVVFLNPRRTETAEAVGEHVFIRPDTDVWFLAAFARELLETGGVVPERVERHMTGLSELRRVVAPWTPERQEGVTRVPAALVRELAAAHRDSGAAALYMSTGVNQGRHGTLCYWLLESINAFSGNLDRRGGTLMGRGLVDMPAEAKRSGRFERPERSPVGGFCSVVDTFPVGVLADQILSREPERVRGLIVWASNPLLGCPNPSGRLERALRELEVLVAIDLFRNETGDLAHYFLPATTFLERADIPYAIQTLCGSQPLRYVHYTDPVLEPPPDVREEWWIYTRLARACGVTLFGSRLANALLQWNARLAYSRWGNRLAVRPGTLIGVMLARAGVGGRRRHLRDHPHGRLLDPNRPGDFLGTDRVLTADGRVHLAPPDFVAAAARLESAYARELDHRDALKLISKRERASLNSWLRNAPGYVKERSNHLHIHPEDAARAGLSDGDTAEIASAYGKVEAPVRVTDGVMPRTVALAHGWGHAAARGLALAREHAGVNSNLLAGDGILNTEALSGMSHLSGIEVSVRRSGAAPRPAASLRR
jgi:anaerobic selenocysteine-containing dehydrogenase